MREGEKEREGAAERERERVGKREVWPREGDIDKYKDMYMRYIYIYIYIYIIIIRKINIFHPKDSFTNKRKNPYSKALI